MPLKGKVRYRVTTQGGKKVRLAFRGNEVVEAKNLRTGAIHTESEFAQDAKSRKRRAEHMLGKGAKAAPRRGR